MRGMEHSGRDTAGCSSCLEAAARLTLVALSRSVDGPAQVATRRERPIRERLLALGDVAGRHDLHHALIHSTLREARNGAGALETSVLPSFPREAIAGLLP